MTVTGRLAAMDAPGQLSFAEFAVPDPDPGAVVVRVLRANVCGSELHIWRGLHPVKKSGGLGHEMVGEVVALGAGVDADSAGAPIAVGDRVVATYFQTCRHCAQCARGQYNLCDNAYRFFGRQPHEWPHFHAAFGTHYYIHPEQDLYRVPDGVSDAAAAGANCALSQVMYGIDRVVIVAGDTVVIQGAGGLGLFASAVASERGARVIVVDPVPARLALATDFGAFDTIDGSVLATAQQRAAAVRDLTGDGADVAIEVAGVPAAFEEGLQLVRRGGRYLVMGNLSPGRTVPFDPGWVTRRSLTLHHVDRYDGRYLNRALRFLADSPLHDRFATLVDAVYPLSGVEDAITDSLERRVTRAAIDPTLP